jgi:hypothetical protein
MSLPKTVRSLQLRIYVHLIMHCEVMRGVDVQLEPFQGELLSFLQRFRGVTAREATTGDLLDITASAGSKFS